ncbi:hypothetical protein TRFO_33788 [Tritrichomonas foetus]|uniref:Uncharacterized protein n=1 Tax=Tritrichomonas foetus TaxID=1144522 RepID=A0A1J4JQE3_9EUKA|nr:hypothetical protein TRFO_33788 [Tritrichomonas foetus]|eukprot:OHS99749.1 hypothetical protein TRFO_33788 [Tritrichomonas foetus]
MNEFKLLLPVIVGSILVGYVLAFNSYSFPDISCAFNFNYQQIISYLSFYVFAAILTPQVIRKYSNSGKYEDIFENIHLISSFSWIPIIFSTNSMSSISFISPFFFGISLSLFYTFNLFLLFRNLRFSPKNNISQFSAVFDVCVKLGFLYENIVFYFSNWRISAFVGCLMSILIFKLFDSIPTGALDNFSMTNEMVSTETQTHLTSFFQHFLISLIKFLPGRYFYQKNAEFVFEFNFSGIIFDSIVVGCSLFYLLFTRLFSQCFTSLNSFSKIFIFTSISASLSGFAFSYFSYQLETKSWSFIQLVLILSTVFRLFFSTFCFSHYSLIVFLSLQKNITIYNTLNFVSAELTAFFGMKLFYLLLNEYVNDIFRESLVCSFLTLLCSIFGIFKIKMLNKTANEESEYLINN